MRFGKVQIALLVLLVVQLGVWLAVSGTSTWRAAADEERLLIDAETVDAAGRIRISESDETSVVLAKDGEAWTLADFDGFPTDAELVDEMLDVLRSIEVRRPVVTRARYHAKLGVADDDYQRKVEIFDAGVEADAEPSVTLYIGTSPAFRVSHVRLAGDDAVYEARGVEMWKFRTRPAQWIEKKLVDLRYDQVQTITLENDSGAFTLERSGEEGWRVVAPEARRDLVLDSPSVDSLVRGAVGLWITDPVGRRDDEAHGFAAPAAVVRLGYRGDDTAEETSGAEPEAGEGGSDSRGAEDASDEEDATAEADALEEVRVVIGAQAPSDGQTQRYATREGFGFTVTVSEASTDKLRETKLADLEKKADEEKK